MTLVFHEGGVRDGELTDAYDLTGAPQILYPGSGSGRRYERSGRTKPSDKGLAQVWVAIA